MATYKVTNLKSKAVYYFNKEQHTAFFRKNCFQDGNFKFNYDSELLSETPILDKLNEVKFNWLDIIYSVCLTAASVLIIIEYAL